MDSWAGFIVSFLVFGGSFGIIFYLFDKLTARNIPTNLKSYSEKTLWNAIKMLVLLFLMGGAIILALS